MRNAVPISDRRTRQLVAPHKADYQDESHLLSDRREGRCVLSYKTAGGVI